MLNRRSLVLGAPACLLCGCSGALHRLPAVDAGQMGLAAAEIGGGAMPPRRILTEREVLGTLEAARDRLQGPAAGVCREIGTGVCTWQVRAVRDRTPNAYATGDGLIVIHRGVVEYAQSEDEVAFVIAHEMAHHAANHVRQSRRNTTTGAGGGTYARAATRDATTLGARAGAGLGRISFSKEQEREADYLAAVTLHRAGYDLSKARNFLVTLGRASSRRETGLLDTHPAGPERLAAWDRAVAEIGVSKGRLPSRA
ncbi:M48 family metallopeptidase [Roseicella aquatilis]|uniref:Peptidase M48 domain-containing protein n=1 Tax=Roseicella aquatilis TaxID=2527868 RepID=A0A4R4DD80_9PROT|nr:M48 family metallopeptidase [Roseicella aquatilis]TCZ57782.1 hypothetical protein EXY23_17605 [Roseicella aquatilis]